MAEKPSLVGMSWCLMGYGRSKLVNGPACMRASGGRVTGVWLKETFRCAGTQ